MRSCLLLLALGASALASPLAGQAKTIAGEWDASMSTPGGVSMFKILFKVDSGKLTGIVKRPAGDVPLAGTVKGDSVRFTYTIDYNGNALNLTMSAVVAGDVMKGTVDMGGMAEDDFTAKRTPPKSGDSQSNAGKRSITWLPLAQDFGRVIVARNSPTPAMSNSVSKG